jgi:putative flippase GtrA
VRVLRFLAAGLVTAVLDLGIFYALQQATGLLFLPLAASTAVSVTFNYLVVRRFIFEATVDHASALPKYVGVHFTGMLIRYGIMRAILSRFHIPVVVAKLAADGVVYSLKYVIQRDFVFRPSSSNVTRTAAPELDRSGWLAAPGSIPPKPLPQSESPS